MIDVVGCPSFVQIVNLKRYCFFKVIVVDGDYVGVLMMILMMMMMI